MKGIKRLTPIVPGDPQPVVFIDGQIRSGFVSGGRTEGRGFPQWAKTIFGGEKVHYFSAPVSDGIVVSLCERVVWPAEHTLMPGNFARCKVCERLHHKALRDGRPI